MTVKIAYAWKDGDKFYLSAIGPRSKLANRPANVYDDKRSLLYEAQQRGLTVEWENAV